MKNLPQEYWKVGWWVSAEKRIVAVYRNDGEVESAKYMVAGRGTFNAEVNGKTITAGELEPNQAYTYDITALIKGGKGESNEYAMTPLAGRQVLIRGVIELRFKDGRVRLYGTEAKNWGELREYPALRKDYPRE